MMIVMQPGAETAEVEAVRARLAQTGVHVVVMPGELTTAIGAIGDPAGVAELGLEGMAGVDRVVPISRPYKLASSELSHHEPSRFDIAGRTVGGGETFCLIAGPCTVESSEQTMASPLPSLPAARRGGGRRRRADRRAQHAELRAAGGRRPARQAGAAQARAASAPGTASLLQRFALETVHRRPLQHVA